MANWKCSFGVLFALTIFIPPTVSDTPADCHFEEVVGTWLIYEIPSYTSSFNCSSLSEGKVLQAEPKTIQLFYPNVAINHYNHKGTWTLIYNQGFELIVNNRIYFAFFNWKKNSMSPQNPCHRTIPGWAHDVHGHDWTCFVGKKVETGQTKNAGGDEAVKVNKTSQLKTENLYKKFTSNKALINHINKVQTGWKASAYSEYENLTRLDMLRRAGGINSYGHRRPTPPESSEEIKRAAEALPEELDWRNLDGVNYVSPIRDQGRCGSCYAFASVALLESRYRILTNNEKKPIFSPQDILDCSSYAQECDGGFAYLIAGKHAQDYGMIEEFCNTYNARKNVCKPTRCKRYYSTDYHYVGGYYGASNEDLMKLALYHNGPIAVGFEVNEDFYYYKSGIYRHVKSEKGPYGWDPLVQVNHAVVVVGYGIENSTKTKYWIVKNSWGRNWGENGYFRILRGTNECGIESVAFEATPIIRPL